MTERERFLRWYESEFGTDQDARLERPVAWAAWQSRCPEGYSVVPNEPTEEMLTKAHQEIDWVRTDQNTYLNNHPSQIDDGSTSCKEDMQDAYRALLSAAPQPGEEA